MMHQERDCGKALGWGCDAVSITSQSAVPHTGFEWHSLLSKAPEFPPVQLALYPSLPPLDPSCTLSTGRKKNRETAEKDTQAGQAKAYRQDSTVGKPCCLPFELKVTKPPKKERNWSSDRCRQSLSLSYHYKTVNIVTTSHIFTERVETLVTLARILIKDKENHILSDRAWKQKQQKQTVQVSISPVKESGIIQIACMHACRHFNIKLLVVSWLWNWESKMLKDTDINANKQY